MLAREDTRHGPRQGGTGKISSSKAKHTALVHGELYAFILVILRAGFSVAFVPCLEVITPMLCYISGVVESDTVLDAQLPGWSLAALTAKELMRQSRKRNPTVSTLHLVVIASFPTTELQSAFCSPVNYFDTISPIP